MKPPSGRERRWFAIFQGVHLLVFTLLWISMAMLPRWSAGERDAVRTHEVRLRGQPPRYVRPWQGRLQIAAMVIAMPAMVAFVLWKVRITGAARHAAPGKGTGPHDDLS